MRGKIAFSVFIGVIFSVLTFVLTLLLVPLKMAVLFALLAFAIAPPFMHISLTVEERRNNKRFAQVEKDSRIPYYHKANGNIVWGKALINGNVYFCEQGLYVVSVEKRPYLIVEIQNSEILKYDFEEIQLHLYLSDGKELHVLLPDAQEVKEQIRAHGWYV